jgi:TrmH family RNA methyltransferase
LDGGSIPEFYIVLVEPKFSGNVGAVARTMMNFGFKNLFLVKPCRINDDCYARAVHASRILDEAKIFNSFEEVSSKLDYLVATSSIETKSDKKHLRNPVLLQNFAEHIFEIKGKVGIVFGREDYGLYNPEIAACDIMLRIPTDDDYLSMNLSHAVAIILYTLFLYKDFNPREKRNIGLVEKEKLFEFFNLLLEEISYPEHKKEKTSVMFKRIMGRSMPSKWEYHTLMGVISKAIENIKKKKESK